MNVETYLGVHKDSFAVAGRVHVQFANGVGGVYLPWEPAEGPPQR